METTSPSYTQFFEKIEITLNKENAPIFADKK